MRLILSVATMLSLATAALLTSTSAKAAPPQKVVIAHLGDVVDIFDEDTGELVEKMYCYEVVEVSEKALGGHAHHDDALDGEALADGTTFVAGDHTKGEEICVYVAAE